MCEGRKEKEKWSTGQNVYSLGVFQPQGSFKVTLQLPFRDFSTICLRLRTNSLSTSERGRKDKQEESRYFYYRCCLKFISPMESLPETEFPAHPNQANVGGSQIQCYSWELTSFFLTLHQLPPQVKYHPHLSFRPFYFLKIMTQSILFFKIFLAVQHTESSFLNEETKLVNPCSTLGAQSLKHWTMNEVSHISFHLE